MNSLKYYLNKNNWHWSILVLLIAVEIFLCAAGLNAGVNSLIHCLWLYGILRLALSYFWYYMARENIKLLKARKK